MPPLHLRSSLLQTVLASLKLRALGKNPMLEASREVIIDAGDGVRLQGFHSPRTDIPSKGTVILLHGWEGSAESTYILHTGRYLYSNGYDIFRLNFRDHGKTHHLNEGIFYSTLLREVYEAVMRAAELSEGGPVFLMGFSLGGNFALRTARRLREERAHPIRHVIAVSPVLDPSKATVAIDAHPVLRRYFLKKWKRSLMRKQELYPRLYDFSRMLAMKTIRELTDALIEQSGLYADTEEYFAGYTIRGDSLEDVTVPLSIVTSRDDPAIPVDDFYDLRLADRSRLIIHMYGGHNGFLQGIRAPAWYEQEAVRVFSQASPDNPGSCARL
ncbi:MAG TPA: alpha/beta fold hydrolase [Deltaproteobacteria bacterium]|nr:alpha/beta fold hydrolase [Deltaproteobacteria bacterium]HQJ09224.1 alpha/beta fold hydrolase [Deltaproteobacteria bacterium]